MKINVYIVDPFLFKNLALLVNKYVFFCECINTAYCRWWIRVFSFMASQTTILATQTSHLPLLLHRDLWGMGTRLLPHAWDPVLYPSSLSLLSLYTLPSFLISHSYSFVFLYCLWSHCLCIQTAVSFYRLKSFFSFSCLLSNSFSHIFFSHPLPQDICYVIM